MMNLKFKMIVYGSKAKQAHHTPWINAYNLAVCIHKQLQIAEYYPLLPIQSLEYIL